MRIFILEDDLSIQKGISLKLQKENHEVCCADSILSSTKYLSDYFDLAIIDLNLPDGNGLDLCKKLRQSWPQTYILILTANDSETDIIIGYELGADDYMTKPFSLSVLLSKINAVQRRLLDTDNSNSTSLNFNPAMQTAVIHGQKILLTKNETRLLNIFLKNAGQILTKEQLLQSLWDIDDVFVDENTLAVNIQRLRSKIKDEKWQLIENIRGVGYRFNKDML